jgi:ribose transport system permease protein
VTGDSTAATVAAAPETRPEARAGAAPAAGDLLAHRRHAERLVETGPLVSLVLLFVVLSFASGAFLSKANLLNVLEANAPIGIAACAGTFVIVAGDLDVSVGAICALAGVLSAKVVIATGSVELGLAAGVAAGALLGLFNGLITTVGRVNSFVATLAGGIVFQSAAQVLAGGELLTPKPKAYTDLGRDALLGIKYSILLFALTAVVTGVLLARGRYGRQVAMVGANAEAARLSGVRSARVRCAAFVLSGVAAAVAGLILTSRSGQTDAAVGGTSFVLAVIAAIAIGGTSLRGGEDAIWRTVVGVLFLGLVTNGLGLLNVDPTYYQLFTGLLILAAVGLQAAGRRLVGADG